MNKKTMNLECFQGEKYLKCNKNYFEGWYFKNMNNEQGIAFIPGIHIWNEERKAFIQIITYQRSYFVNYEIDEFKYHQNPFSIQIQNNIFSKEGIWIDIEDDQQDLKIYGKLDYYENINIKKSFVCPNIMGPFSYIPFMECNHAILCMRNRIQGSIYLNDELFIFDCGVGYIEKDWGYSFPKSYVWCQGNRFENEEASFMISIADIPFQFLSFQGFLCVLIIKEKEYRFTTYNHAKILKYEVYNDFLEIRLQKGSFVLEISTKIEKGLQLIAPVEGRMNKKMNESLIASVSVTLYRKDCVLFSGISKGCGLEIVN